jgi:hypothetical protein
MTFRRSAGVGAGDGVLAVEGGGGPVVVRRVSTPVRGGGLRGGVSRAAPSSTPSPSLASRGAAADAGLAPRVPSGVARPRVASPSAARPSPLSETTVGTFDAGAAPAVEGGPGEVVTSCGLVVNGKESYVPGAAGKGCATSGVTLGEGCGKVSAACVCGATG